MESTETLWAEPATTTPPQSDPSIAPDTVFDVVVVGAGITGVTAASLLKQAGKKVMLLEARQVGSGVTGATTAHLTEILDTRYHQLISTFGKDAARMARDASRAAIDFVERTCERVATDAAFERVDGHLYATRAEQTEELQREKEALFTLGTEAFDVDLGAPFSGPAFCVRGQGLFHPLRYVRALAGTVPGDGSAVVEHTAVQSIEEGDPCVLTTASGARIRAERVVLATHAALTVFALQTKVASYRSYVVSMPSDLPCPGLVWDLDDPYHYFRTATIGSVKHWIAGGEDHKTGQSDDTRAPLERLAAYTRSLGLPQPTHAWSAQVVEPVDGLPYIGALDKDGKVFVATGFSGNGMTYGTAAARILADVCSRLSNPFAELFDPGRLPKVKTLPEYVHENASYPIEFVRGVLGAATRRGIGDVAPGTGEVVRSGAKAVAAYRDADGKVHAVSAVCTHLGCVVRFNAAEKTWDCPCHGSRFALDGSVVDGPAYKPLARVFPVE